MTIKSIGQLILLTCFLLSHIPHVFAAGWPKCDTLATFKAHSYYDNDPVGDITEIVKLDFGKEAYPDGNGNYRIGGLSRVVSCGTKGGRIYAKNNLVDGDQRFRLLHTTQQGWMKTPKTYNEGTWWKSLHIEADTKSNPDMHLYYEEYAKVTQGYEIPGGSRADLTSGWISLGNKTDDPRTVNYDAPQINGYRCTGWKNGSGSAPSSGSSTRISFTIGGDSSFTWVYTPVTTVEKYSGPGLNRPDRVSNWYAEETSWDPRSLTAPTIDGYRIEGWENGTGNIPNSGTESTVSFTQTSDSSLTWVYYRPEVAISLYGVPGNSYAGFTPEAESQHYDLDGTVTLTAPATIGADPDAPALMGWSGGTGDIGHSGDLTNLTDNGDGSYSLTFKATEDSSLEWEYIGARLVTVDLAGERPDILPVGLEDKFTPVSYDGHNEDPANTNNKYTHGTAITLSAPVLFEDQGNDCFYRLKGWYGTGSLPEWSSVDVPTIDLITDQTVTVVLENDTSIRWVYEKVYQLKVATEGLSIGLSGAAECTDLDSKACAEKNQGTISGTSYYRPETNLAVNTLLRVGGTVDFPVGQEPRSMVQADFNQDGFLDVAVVNRLSNDVTVLLGYGDGNFRDGLSTKVEDSPAAIGSGDFNQDGIPDLAVANSSSRSISILIGEGNGKFSPAPLLSTTAPPQGLVVGAFNNDNYPDLAVTHGGSLSLFPGQADGNFSAAVTTAQGTLLADLRAADLNGDTYDDLVVADPGASALRVLVCDGEGGFTPGTSLVAGSAPGQPVAGDFNGDGLSDLAVVDGIANSVMTYSNVGTADSPAFAAGVNYPVGTAPTTLSALDFNDDGTWDLVTTDSGDNGLSLLINKDDDPGTFAPAIRIATQESPYQVVAGDFNSDGISDLLVTNSGADNLSLFPGTSGNFAPRTDLDLGADTLRTAAGDFNADQVPDLVTLVDGSDQVQVRLGNGDGSFKTPAIFSLEGGLAPRGLVVADLNGDAVSDLLVANSATNNVSVLLGTGATTGIALFLDAVNYDVGGSPADLALGDIDADGKLDMAVANSDDGTVSLLSGNGDGSFVLSTDPPLQVGSATAVAMGDFNGDDHDDIAVTAVADSSLRVMLNRGDGTFYQRVEYAAGHETSSLASEDFNGDGYMDLAVTGQGDDRLRVFIARSNGTFTAGVDYPVGDGPSAVQVVDFDLDGIFDLMVTNKTAATVSLLPGAGDGTFLSKTDFATDTDPVHLVASDLNLDGQPDMVVANQGGQSLSLLLFDKKSTGFKANYLDMVCLGVFSEYGNPPLHDAVLFGDRMASGLYLDKNTQLVWKYRAVRRWVVGEAITAPPGADGSSKPEIEVIVGKTTDDQASNSFFWAEHDRDLYPVRELPLVNLTWSNDLETPGFTVWPPKSRMQRHVVGAPARLQPETNPYASGDIKFTESKASIEEGVFQALEPGRSVVLFVDGPVADTGKYPVANNLIVESVEYQDVLSDVDWEVGTRITGDRWNHSDPEGRNGYVFFKKAPYDAVGPDGAYSRADREGVILPVNTVGPDDSEPLVVIWYQTGTNGIGWPVRAVRYNVDWPDSAGVYDTIVIASGKGAPADQSLPDELAAGKVYYQNDPDMPGYNPNEEHALMLGSKLYALRDDLNGDDTSAAYVLLKYKELGQWAMKVFAVIAEEGEHRFDNYHIKVGDLLEPLPPLHLLPKMAESKEADPDSLRWLYRDHKGDYWARAASFDTDDQAKLQMHWYYPMQKGFYYPDYDGDDLPDAEEGDSVPFRNGGKRHSDPSQVVTYAVDWPAPEDAPVLKIGETLTSARNDLPDVAGQDAVQVVFDQGIARAEGPLVKLYDPFSPVCVDKEALPDGLQTETLGDKVLFPELPYALRSRLYYSQAGKQLCFAGQEIDFGTGQPLLLPNVMSSQEMSTIEDLSSSWKTDVANLYDKSRNPNSIVYSEPISYPFVQQWNEELQGFLSAFPGGWLRNYAERMVQSSWDRIWGPPLGLELVNGEVKTQKLVGRRGALTSGMVRSSEGGWVVLAVNDDESLGSAAVKLYPIRVEGGPNRGDIKVIKPDNIFDEKLGLRHSGDFGGEPEKFHFVWYYQPDSSGVPPRLPEGGPQDTDGWIKYDEGAGLNEITIGGPGKLTLSDNWFMVHYYYGEQPGGGGASYPALAIDALDSVDETTIKEQGRDWSAWAGDSVGVGAMLAEGWIKRVTGELNPFEARVEDFRNNATNTDVSMLTQLGARYEGDIALSSDPDYINSLGLIESYQTILNRGMGFMGFGGENPINYGPANVALLNAATRIADFYTLLGNEAYADAVDPTIGFDTADGQIGNAGSTLFAFKNQLDSLLEEELVLLRGRDDTTTGTRIAPIYNRLMWNYVNGEGEVAYNLAYNVSDQDGSGTIDELDARTMYPQGHGDAWGNYLTATKMHYLLLRQEGFNWEPRAESVLVGGSPVLVDYEDERKFAGVAAAKAKVGGEILDLTYRAHYVDDPAGQWQGYKDTLTAENPDGSEGKRAWGVDGWARRAGQAAYFDWVVANAILPAEDPNPDHTGIQKIDRTTVPELEMLASQFNSMQELIDRADSGLNPLGLAKGVVPFDIDPSLLSGGDAKTHFEQIFDRAQKALQNAADVYQHANHYTLMKRSNEDSLEGFKKELDEEETDYKNRLIEVFGYPYAGDIGPGKTYPAGYDGPDWAHFMYVDLPELTGKDDEDIGSVDRFTVSFDRNDDIWGFWDTGLDQGEGKPIEVIYHSNENTPWMVAPDEWGERRAPGEIQLALSELVKAHADFQRGLTEYDIALGDTQGALEMLKMKHGVLSNEIQILDKNHEKQNLLEAAIGAAHAAATVFYRLESATGRLAEAAKEGLPTMAGPGGADVTAPGRAAIWIGGGMTAEVLGGYGDVLENIEFNLGQGKEHVQRVTDIRLFKADAKAEVQELIAELDGTYDLVVAKQQELYMLAEVVQQAQGSYRAAVARGERLLSEREKFRKRTAASVQDYRYQDMGFRVFRNDALQKYRASFDLAARYTYLAATAYDYETNLLGSESGAGQQFLTDIVRQRSLGEVIGDTPVAGTPGLADPLARLEQNFGVYKTQLGFNNPQTETNRFSLRSELLRFKPESEELWRSKLKSFVVDNLWELPEFKRFCRPFSREPAPGEGEPGLVIPFSTEVTFGKNFFGQPLAGGDSAYDPTNFATKIRSVGVWFGDYNGAGLSNTPRVYLVPVGADVLRSPSGDGFRIRRWHVVDQKLPVPFPIGASDLSNDEWIPLNDSLSDTFGDIRRFSSLRAYHDSGSFSASEMSSDSRLVGRSVWNTRWLLIIPGGTLLSDSNAGLQGLIDTVGDIKLFFQTYAYSGN